MLRFFKPVMLAGAMGAALLAINVPVRADIIPKLVSGSPTPLGSDWLWSYTAKLTDDQFLQPGAFFTIYDFNGFVSVNSTPADWMFSSSNVGVTPVGLIIADSPAIPNLTWTYTGLTTGNGPITYTGFSAISHSGNKQVSNYGANASLWDPGELDHGLPTMNKGKIIAPAASTVPEPASMALLGLGAAPLLRLRRRNRKA